MASVEAYKDLENLKKMECGYGAKVVDNEMKSKALLEGEEDSNFWFWARQLSGFVDNKSVVFAAFENNKFIKLQTLDIVKFLKEIDYFNSVENINQLPQPYFFKITFDAESMDTIFCDTVSHIDGHPIKILEVKSIPQHCIISVSNLPPDIIEQLLLPQLSVWGDCTRLSFQYIPKHEGGKVQIGSTKIHFKIKDEYSLSDIPYFLRVMGFKIFLYIRGRQRICFRCNSFNHMVSHCPYRFCAACRSIKLVPHQCSLSYAAVITGPDKSVMVPVMHDRLLEELDGEDGDKTKSQDTSCQSVNDGSSEEESNEEIQIDGSLVDNSLDTNGVDNNRGLIAPKRMRTRSLSNHTQRKSFLKEPKADLIVVSGGGKGKGKRKSKNDSAIGSQSKERKKSEVNGKKNHNGSEKSKGQHATDRTTNSMSGMVHAGKREASLSSSDSGAGEILPDNVSVK